MRDCKICMRNFFGSTQRSFAVRTLILGGVYLTVGKSYWDVMAPICALVAQDGIPSE